MRSTPPPWCRSADVSLLRYDPERIGDLERRATAAAADLVALASDDPAAAAPLHAVRQARAHLEHEWLPLLRRLAASEAMLTWSSSGPPVDPAVVDAVFTRLGGAGTAELLIELGSQVDDPDEALAAAATVRYRLVESSRRSGLPPGFARDFVDACVNSIDRADRNAGVALSFLFGGGRLGTAFLVEATRAIVEHEVAAGGDEPEYGGSLWGSTSGIGAPRVRPHRPARPRARRQPGPAARGRSDDGRARCPGWRRRRRPPGVHGRAGRSLPAR